MNRMYLLLFFTVLMLSVRAQSIPFITVADAYDYAVGDTLEYHSGSSSGASYSMINVVTVRENRADTILYTFKSIMLNSTNQVTGTSTYSTTILNRDSACYVNVGQILDSTSIYISGPDTVYRAFTHISFSQYCSLPGEYIQITMTGHSDWIRGLGRVAEYDCNDNSYCLPCGASGLVYAHKVIGNRIYGTAINIYNAIDEVSGNNRPQVYAGESGIEIKGISNDKPVTLVMYDITGREIMRLQDVQEHTTIHRDGISSGLYLWKIIAQGQVAASGKIVLR